MLKLHLGTVDYVILAIYFAVVLGIGFIARLSIKSDLDFFLSGRSLPAWITGIAFIAANLGALEILGQSANGAQYGVPTVHYYWIGAVPAMVFLGLVMMPFYYGSKVRSVPEYLRLRFNEPTHAFNAGTFAVATVLISGVNLFALALIIHLMLGWSIAFAILVAAALVLVYITLGGLTSAIYNEVLQFFVIVAALLPLTLVALHSVGGISGLKHKVENFKPLGSPGLHAWQGLGIRPPHQHARLGLDRGRVRARVRARLRLLDDQLRRGPAGAVGQEPGGVAADAADRRDPEAVLPAIIILPGLIAVVDRARARRHGGQRVLQHRDPAPDRQLPAGGDARHRGDRPDGGVHGGRRRERDRVQHGRHLRHHPGVRRARTATRRSTYAPGAG